MHYDDTTRFVKLQSIKTNNMKDNLTLDLEYPGDSLLSLMPQEWMSSQSRHRLLQQALLLAFNRSSVLQGFPTPPNDDQSKYNHRNAHTSEKVWSGFQATRQVHAEERTNQSPDACSQRSESDGDLQIQKAIARA